MASYNVSHRLASSTRRQLLQLGSQPPAGLAALRLAVLDEHACNVKALLALSQKYGQQLQECTR
jgi:hypothetical protein